MNYQSPKQDRFIQMRFSLTGLLILAVGVIAWQLHESGNKDGTYSQSMKLAEESFQSKMKARDTRILALENDLSLTVAEGTKVVDSLQGQIKRLKSGVVPVRLIKITDTTAVRAQIVRRDSVITVQDTTISKLKANEERILSQHHEIVSELKGKNNLLDSANTAKLNYMVKQGDIIESQDKKITRLERLSKILGISTGTLSVILALVVAL